MALEFVSKVYLDTSKAKVGKLYFNLTVFRRLAYLRETQNTNKMHWAKLRAKKWPVDHALNHFDYFYGSVFRQRWPSIRIALLSPNKYCAVVNTFVSHDLVVEKLKDTSAINVRSYYEARLKKLNKQNRQSSSGKSTKTELQSNSRDSDSAIASTAATSEEYNNHVDEDDTSRSSLQSEEPMKSTPKMEDADVTFQEEYQDDYADISMNDYVPVTQMKYDEEIITEEEYYSFYQPESELSINIVEEPMLKFPPLLNVYTFPRGDVSHFPPPSVNGINLLDYYLMDGASILPSLVLGVNQDDVVGDLCAAPGGKSLSILFSLFPSKLVCADKSPSRVEKMKRVFGSYVPHEKLAEKILKVVQLDVCSWPPEEIFDKILLDVPCTNDRLSLRENDNNIFHVAKVKERVMVPQVQKSLLSHALKLLKQDGSLVYSTCSLSPIQNDGVVHMSLKDVWEETKFEFVVKNLYPSLAPFRGLYCIKSCRYGQLVIPFLPCNYGPMYICKITRLQ